MPKGCIPALLQCVISVSVDVDEIATVALRMDDCFANQRDDGGVLGLKALQEFAIAWNSMVGLEETSRTSGVA